MSAGAQKMTTSPGLQLCGRPGAGRRLADAGGGTGDECEDEGIGSGSKLWECMARPDLCK